MGTGRDSQITQNNCEGLYWNIETRNTRAVLSGDVPYKCISPHVSSNCVDFLHVPHHCSDMDLGKIMCGRCHENSTAIISTNRKSNGKLNVCQTHYDELKYQFNNVIATIENPSGNDDTNLSVHINMLRCYHVIK